MRVKNAAWNGPWNSYFTCAFLSSFMASHLKVDAYSREWLCCPEVFKVKVRLEPALLYASFQYIGRVALGRLCLITPLQSKRTLSCTKCALNSACISTLQLAQFDGKFEQIGRKGEKGLLLPPGSLCNNGKGELSVVSDYFRYCSTCWKP